MSDRNLLLVDDEPNILKALKRLLRRDGYNILLAGGGDEALQLLQNHQVSIIISDHRMPVMTGIEFLAKVKELYPDTIRIVLSGFSDIDTVTEAINQGNIYKFIAKPWDDTQLRTTIQEAFEHFELREENNRLADELKVANAGLMQKNEETSSLVEQIVNHINDGIVVVDADKQVLFSNPSALTLLIEHYRVLPGDEFKLPFKENHVLHQRLPRPNKDDLVLEVRSSLITHEGKPAFLVTLHDNTDIERIHAEKQHFEASIKKTLLQMVKTISTTIEMREPHTAGHQNKVAELAVAIGKEMELDEDVLEGLNIGSLVYDIGKSYIPAEVLNKPESLNEYERLLIQKHPSIGYEIMSSVDFPWPIADMILQHHEYIDGSGYPNGINGDEMQLEAKIIAVVDTVIAMSEHRPYREARPVNKILDFIKQESGIKFDPVVVKTCIKVISENQHQLA